MPRSAFEDASVAVSVKFKICVFGGNIRENGVYGLLAAPAVLILVGNWGWQSHPSVWTGNSRGNRDSLYIDDIKTDFLNLKPVENPLQS